MAAGRECYHCKQWIEPGQTHDCWTTTAEALTRDLSEDLRDAWERLRETVLDFGEQRTYASHNSIMFSRKACYCFVRPKRSVLEVCFFLGRALKTSRVKRVLPASRQKVAHLVDVRHRDEVEAPLTEWLREAYDTSLALSARPAAPRAATTASAATRPARSTKASEVRTSRPRPSGERQRKTSRTRSRARRSS